MILPVAKAKPTKMMGALSASYVQATLIFLDGGLAFGARLGMSKDPSHILRFGPILDDPSFDCATVQWHMSLLVAFPAPTTLAVIAKDVKRTGLVAMHCTIAIGSRTPL